MSGFSNLDLVVLPERPIGFTIRVPRMGGATAYRCPELTQECYYCPHCSGWIMGEPFQKSISNGRMLSGRLGHSDSCIRCSKEIAFQGRMF